LAQGEGLWRVNERAFVVRHICTPAELELFDTDARMLAVPGGFSVTEGPEGGNSRVHATESPRTNGG